MHVILSAFQNRLTSEPMMWPEGLPPTIDMYLDMSRFTSWDPEPPKLEMIFPKKGVFEKRDTFIMIKINGVETTAQVYELVDVR